MALKNEVSSLAKEIEELKVDHKKFKKEQKKKTDAAVLDCEKAKMELLPMQEAAAKARAEV